MDLNEYIKQSYKRPNRQILESFGANEALIEYLKYTPWNTNFAVIDSLIEDSSSSLVAVVGTAVVGTNVVGDSLVTNPISPTGPIK